jgi:hypothetical protein
MLTCWSFIEKSPLGEFALENLISTILHGYRSPQTVEFFIAGAELSEDS